MPPEITERFLAARSAAPGTPRAYRPAVLGTGRVHYVDAKTGTDEWRTVALLATVSGESPADVWRDAERLADGEPALLDEPEPGAAFADLPPELARARATRPGASRSRRRCTATTDCGCGVARH